MNKHSPHKQSAHFCLERLPAMMAMTILQLLVRLAALTPLFAIAGGATFGLEKRWVPAAGLVLSAVLWMFLALPFRFYSRGALWLASRGSKERVPFNYTKWLKLTGARLKRFLPWGLPLFVYIIGFYYLWNIASATQMPRLFITTGKLIGGKFLHGAIIWILVFLCVLVVAVIGWRRYLPVEFIAENTSRDQLFAEALKAKKACGKQLARATMKNILVLLPAIAAVLFVLAMDLAPSLKGSFRSDLFTVLTAFTKMDFSAIALAVSALMLTLLYVPFVLFRKGALASVLADFYG